MRVDGQGWPAIIGAEPSRSSGESLVAARALVEVGACFKGAAIARSSVGVVPSPSLRLQLDLTAGSWRQGRQAAGSVRGFRDWLATKCGRHRRQRTTVSAAPLRPGFWRERSADWRCEGDNARGVAPGAPGRHPTDTWDRAVKGKRRAQRCPAGQRGGVRDVEGLSRLEQAGCSVSGTWSSPTRGLAPGDAQTRILVM